MLRLLFFTLIARPLVFIFLGLNVRHAQRMPKAGPAIIVANHNSHLDTLVLTTLFPLKLLPSIRPVAAVDYFTKSKTLAWFTTHIINAIFIDRDLTASRDPLSDVHGALAQGDIVILYPEGSRGEPERLATFKGGVARLAKQHPDIPVVPIFFHGLGKALPKDDWLPVPFFIDVFVGDPIYFSGNRKQFMNVINEQMQGLAKEGNFPVWD